MRWPVFILFAYLFVVLEVSLSNALRLGGTTPSFSVVLLVFIALLAPRVSALWACWVLGLLVDLNTPLVQGELDVGPMIGPCALGYVFAGLLLIQIRPMLFRHRALTFAVMTCLCVIASSLVIVFIYAVHGWGWYPAHDLDWAASRPAAELLRRGGGAVYSGLLALFVGPALLWTMPLWSFRGGLQHHPARR